MIHDSAVREAELPTAEIVTHLRSFIGSHCLAPLTRPREPLLDILVHGQDVALAVGRPREMPLAAARDSADRVWTMRIPPRPRPLPSPARRRRHRVDPRKRPGGPRPDRGPAPAPHRPPGGGPRVRRPRGGAVDRSPDSPTEGRVPRGLRRLEDRLRADGSPLDHGLEAWAGAAAPGQAQRVALGDRFVRVEGVGRGLCFRPLSRRHQGCGSSGSTGAPGSAEKAPTCLCQPWNTPWNSWWGSCGRGPRELATVLSLAWSVTVNVNANGIVAHRTHSVNARRRRRTIRRGRVGAASLRRQERAGGAGPADP
jgi:hypothetical protein